MYVKKCPSRKWCGIRTHNFQNVSLLPKPGLSLFRYKHPNDEPFLISTPTLVAVMGGIANAQWPSPAHVEISIIKFY